MQVDAQAAVHAAEEAFQSQEGTRMLAALQGCDRLLQAMPPEQVIPETKAPDAADPLAEERALLWLWRGRLLVIADQPDVVVKGLHSLDQAIARLSAAGDRAGAEEALAIAWMNRGSGLFRLGSRDALAEAVRSYDQAIVVLERIDGPRNTLGAAWMNRGVGLMHLDEAKEAPESVAARLADAAKSLERAIAVLQPLAATQQMAQRNLASTWANLGILRTRRQDAEGAAEAHRHAVQLFRPLAAEGDMPATFELAARLFNLGQACGAAGETEAALTAGRESLSLLATLPANDAQVAELGLRTRHALCVILGGLLAAGRAQAEDPDRAARLEEAGDLVEDGLASLRGRGELPEGIAAAGARLYEFGAWLYRTQQPRFLGEFLLDHLDEGNARTNIAAATVQVARQAMVQSDFSATLGGDMDRMLDLLQDLGEVESRLKARGVAV